MLQLCPNSRQDCLFLDFDGTLVDFAPTPDAIKIDPALPDLLSRLAANWQGAVALITGRSIAAIDHFLQPWRPSMAGLHGLERRNANGGLQRIGQPAWIASARSQLQMHAERCPGLLLEDKSLALTLHFRSAPHWEPASRVLMQNLAAQLGDSAALMAGPKSLEIRPAGYDKAGAVSAFLDEIPFRGRRPIYIGDDSTDTKAMQTTLERGGQAIAVGTRITAPSSFRTLYELRHWLTNLT